MPTRLYLHAAANDQSGTFPTTPSATISITYQYSLAATLRKMDTTVGTSQASGSATTAASLATQVGYVGQWVSPPLAAGTYGGAGVTMTMNYAHAHNNASADIGESVRMHCRFWRPSTGAQVGVYYAYASTFSGTAEPGAIDSERVNIATSGATTGVTVQDGDVLTIELFSRNGQAASNAYIGHFYYDGTTENTTLNAVVSNHASFFETSETLNFLSTGISGGGSMTLGDITAVGDGTVDITGASTQSVGGVTSTAAGDVVATGVEDGTLGLVSLSAAGTVTDEPVPEPEPVTVTETDDSAGSGASSYAPRRVFQIPSQEPKEFSLDDIYPQANPVQMPPAQPLINAVAYTPLTAAMGVYAPRMAPARPSQSPRVEIPEDDDFYEVAGLLAMLL